MPNPGDGDHLSLSIIANDGVGSLSVLAYGTTGGNALNDYTQDDGFLIMTATGPISAMVMFLVNFHLTAVVVRNWMHG